MRQVGTSLHLLHTACRTSTRSAAGYMRSPVLLSESSEAPGARRQTPLPGKAAWDALRVCCGGFSDGQGELPVAAARGNLAYFAAERPGARCEKGRAWPPRLQ